MRAAFLTLLLSIGNLPAVALAKGQVAPVTHRELTVATLQLGGLDDAAWEARREQVLATLKQLQPDVISIQQVRQSGRRDAACWLAGRLRYSCDFITADPPSQAERHGGALLTRLPVEEDGITLLHPPGRYSAAGMMRVRVGGQPLNIYLARLRPAGDDSQARQHQANDLLTWIGATANGLPSLITGDFAAGTAELVRTLPGYQPARRNPSLRPEPAPPSDTGHGLDVLFPVKSFIGLRPQAVHLPAGDDLPAIELGMMATLRLQDLHGEAAATH